MNRQTATKLLDAYDAMRRSVGAGGDGSDGRKALAGLRDVILDAMASGGAGIWGGGVRGVDS